MLASAGPLTSRALAGPVHVNPSTLVGILDRLEGKGLVSRRRDSGDRRSVFVELTKSGVAFVAEAPSPLQAALADGLRQLNEKQQRKLALSLEEVVRLMQADSLKEMPVLASSRSTKRAMPNGPKSDAPRPGNQRPGTRSRP
jgi:DNA-binding MarR family transcriptional regulator